MGAGLFDETLTERVSGRGGRLKGIRLFKYGSFILETTRNSLTLIASMGSGIVFHSSLLSLFQFGKCYNL